jgi:uncharacterized protein YjbI with pentapeptide repeats
MQTEDRNFKGQDLRGQSFKGQDLTGADFSDCDLRGVDFSAANLTAAKFCRAKMGRTRKMTIVLLGFQLLLSVLAGIMAGFGNVSIAGLFKEILKDLAIYSDSNLIIAVFSYALLLAIVTELAVTLKRLAYVLWFFAVIIAVAGYGSVGDAVAVAGFVALIGSVTIAGGVTAGAATVAGGTVAGVVVLALVGVGAGSIVGAVAIAVAVAGSAAGAVAEAGDGTTLGVAGAVAVAVAGAVAGTVNILLSVYFGWRASKREEPQLLILRNLSLKLACLGGTQFAFAILKDVDFSEADLKYARFSNAKIISCCFLHAKNNHLALTNDTPLALRKVRDLVIDGIITDKNFSTLDLRGLDFSNLNLQGFDFSHANLSGANLSHTQMTGAILEGWAIDTETRLDDIECSYYYYLENGEKKRMPPEGEEYTDGEFTRIFQKIANTIDFIAHNEMELAAIKLS